MAADEVCGAVSSRLFASRKPCRSNSAVSSLSYAGASTLTHCAVYLPEGHRILVAKLIFQLNDSVRTLTCITSDCWQFIVPWRVAHLEPEVYADCNLILQLNVTDVNQDGSNSSEY